MTDIISVPYHDIDLVDLELAKTIGDTLETHYPGWGWQVNINSDKTGGVVSVLSGVLNDDLHSNYGYVLHLANIYNYKDTVKKAILAGGELLERCNMPRSRWEEQVVKSIEVH
jgi:hypothetical protein